MNFCCMLGRIKLIITSLHIGGVVGVFVGDTFIEESNFEITEIVMKVKLSHSEAGWLAKVVEVTNTDSQ